MTSIINIKALAEGAVIALVAGVGMVVAFSLGVLSLQAGADDSSGVRSGRTSKTAARALAAVAFLVVAAIVIVGLGVMLNK